MRDRHQEQNHATPATTTDALHGVLRDGTNTSAPPIRKPSARSFEGSQRPDPDGIVVEYASNGREFTDVDNEERTRSLDIIATNLNTRRALRELVQPSLAETAVALRSMQEQLSRMEAMLARVIDPEDPLHVVATSDSRPAFPPRLGEERGKPLSP